ncbi:MAG: TIGR04086 family membrane protein [Ruminococcaceae bacterium]|nr:TIGR04086 family membrane protein [Oscillospiraceae bacterium]
MANTNKKDEPAGLSGLAASVIRGTAAGIAAAVLSALTLSAAAMAAADPDSLIGWMAMAALMFGALISGIVSVRCDPGRSIGTGIVSGGAYVLILWLISLFFRGSAEHPPTPLMLAVWYALTLVCAVLGALMGRGRGRRIGEGKHSPTALARRQLRRK